MKSKLNRRAILQLIRSGRATSQLHLARSLDAPPNTINGLIKGLLRAGDICPARTETYGRGRPLQHYRIAQPAPVLAIQWLGSVWHAAVFRDQKLAGTAHPRHTRPIKSLPGALSVLREIRDLALKDVRLTPGKLGGAVLAINAQRTGRGGVWSSSVVPWIMEGSEAAFAEALGCRVQLDSGAGLAPAELRARAPEGVRSLLVFNVGDGVSAHGRTFDEAWGATYTFAGELGHVVADPLGPPCGCGHRGCLEALISGPALLARLERDIAAGTSTQMAKAAEKSPAELFALLEKLGGEGGAGGAPDKYAGALLEEFITRAAWGISVAANLLNPDVIVLSGYGLQGREAWRARIAERARSFVLQPLCGALRLEFPRLGLEEHLREIAAALEPAEPARKHAKVFTHEEK